MTQNEFDRKLFNLAIKVKTNLGLTMVKIGQTAIARIKQRIIEEGKDAKGGKFPPYSTDPMLVGCKSFRKKDCTKFFGKEKNKQHRWATIQRGGKNYRLAYLEGGYRELKDISLGAGAGDKVNFSFTNEMWSDIHIVSSSLDHDNGVVEIGALRNSEQEKLYYNTERNKNKGGNEILDLSKDEIEELQELYKVEIVNIFKSVL